MRKRMRTLGWSLLMWAPVERVAIAVAMRFYYWARLGIEAQHREHEAYNLGYQCALDDIREQG